MGTGWVSPANINTSGNAGVPNGWGTANANGYIDPSSIPGMSDLSGGGGTNYGQLGSALSMIPASFFPTIGSKSGTTNSQLNTNQNLTGSSTSGYGAAGNDVIAQLLPMVSKLAGNTNLAPYQAQQTQGINQQANNQVNSTNSDLAARGLSRSPAAATAINNIQNARQGSITNLNQQIPLLSNQLNQQNSAAINGILGSLPKVGTTSQSGSTNQTGNTTENVSTKSGGGVAGLFGGIGAALANLFG